MQEAITLLQENQSGFLATVDNGLPRVRAFGFQFVEDGKFYFFTANTKDVYKQLIKTPYVEFATMSKDKETVRIRGEIKFTKDIKIIENIFKNSPTARSIYKTLDNPVLEVFFIEHGEAIVFDFSGKSPRVYNF